MDIRFINIKNLKVVIEREIFQILITLHVCVDSYLFLLILFLSRSIM